MKRENFKSRLGFILISAGCAIGIGNVWKFPYVAGRNGGGIFVLFYLLFLVMVGAPALTMEFAVGRASRKSVLGCYQELEPKGSKWHLHGYAALFGNYVIMMFYTTVAGWMISYFYRFLANDFYGLDTEVVSEKFSNMLADPREMLFWMALIVILGFLICSMGLQNGVEKISKPMMIGLLGLIVILAVNSMMLPGGAEGIKFYLVPNWEQVKKVGVLNVIIAAMNQAFFTLSVGMGGMEIFGSYMDREHTLLGESLQIAGLDTFVALMSGLIIFPSCFAYNVQPGVEINYATGEIVSLDTLSRMQFKKGLKAVAMAGIAVPERFFSMLKAHGLEVRPIALPDHYDYSKNPFKDCEADLIFITEKDAVKCRKHADLKKDERIYVVPLETKLDKFLVDFVEKKITAAAKKSKEAVQQL